MRDINEIAKRMSEYVGSIVKINQIRELRSESSTERKFEASIEDINEELYNYGYSKITACDDGNEISIWIK